MKPIRSRPPARARISPILFAAFAIASSWSNPAAANEPCSAMQGLTIPAESIGLPTLGAVIDRATKEVVDSGLPWGVSPKTITYCQLVGRVLPVEAVGPDNTPATGGLPITFQVNLPDQWNRRSMQFGGGGFDGELVTGTGNVSHALAGSQTPLQRGYATLGSDSGHKQKSIHDGSFGLRPEALRNFTGDALKKVRDAALVLIKARYGSAPDKAYFSGGSTGGRETLAVTQRWPQDYDGVIAHYPALQFLGLMLHANAVSKAMYAKGGFLDALKMNHLNNAVVDACDGLDGLRDGLINNVAACHFNPSSLRCKGNIDWGYRCLTDAQIRTVNAIANDLDLAFPLANNVTRALGYEILGGTNFGSPLGAGLLGINPDSDSLLVNGYVHIMHTEYLKYIISGNPQYDFRQFNPVTGGEWMSRVQEVSAMHDAMNTNLDAFRNKGGKVLIVHGTSDTVVPMRGTIDYHQRLKQRYGAGPLRDFLRFYTVAGFGHGVGRYQLSWNALDALENWVEHDQPPENLESKDVFSPVGRSRPLCEYPAFPRYQGGWPNQASSYTCSND
ncbi:MAG TPA: tannase/feruloyl esterase family alpha/beta hydrolase [Hydrogenophaga sp.]